MNAKVLLLAGFVCLLLSPTAARADDFALRDGDTVVFLGDSITAARTYGKIIERYTLMRYPGSKVRFVNAGQGGDTAAGGLKRLDKDVFQQGATILTVAYGVNDIGWGVKADDEHKKAYLDGIRGIVEACKKKKVRVFICSAAITGADPEKSEDSYLQKMCDEGMALSKELGGNAIDVQRTMRDIQKKVWKSNEGAKDDKAKSTLHAGDGIHLSDLGQLAMAYAILKGLGASKDVSSAKVDFKTAKVTETAGCKVTDLKTTANTVTFTRLDDGLPLTLGPFSAFSFRFVPIPDELSRYMLTVGNLPAGRYEVLVDDRTLGSFTEKQLGNSVNIASATSNVWLPGGPWDAQSALLKELTEARSEIDMTRGLTDGYITRSPNKDAVKEQATKLLAGIEELQRMVAKPVPYHFIIRPAPETSKK